MDEQTSPSATRCTDKIHNLSSNVTDGVPVEIDFSPLGATNFTYIGYDRGLLVGRSTGPARSIVVGRDWSHPPHSRVNPFWRFAEGGILRPYYPLVLKEPGTAYDVDVVHQKATDEWNDPSSRRCFRLTTDRRRNN